MNRVLYCILAFVMCGLFFVASPALSADTLDINTATVEQLTVLPGIGPALAAKIVEYRTTKPFASAEQLMDVKGIGAAKYAAIKDQVTVGQPAVPTTAPKVGAPKVEAPKVEVPVKKQ